MNVEFAMQLFWSLLIVLGFVFLLIVPTAIYEFMLRRDYTRLVRIEAARQRWAEMMDDGKRI